MFLLNKIYILFLKLVIHLASSQNKRFASSSILEIFLGVFFSCVLLDFLLIFVNHLLLCWYLVLLRLLRLLGLFRFLCLLRLDWLQFRRFIHWLFHRFLRGLLFLYYGIISQLWVALWNGWIRVSLAISRLSNWLFSFANLNLNVLILNLGERPKNA